MSRQSRPYHPADTPADEEQLFAEAMADVRPLPQDRHIPEPVWIAPRSISEREREVLRELDAFVAESGPFELSDTDQFITGHVPGLDPRVMQRLIAGEFFIEAEIDLHGVRAADARRLLEQFLIDAHARGLRCVRIIHGRGRGSPGGVPVIKSQMPRWLTRGPARFRVLAYATAAPKHGGLGASCVLLRRGGLRDSS